MLADGQPPFPSQLAARSATPPVQLGARQGTDEPAKPAHAIRSTPSHNACAQGVPPVAAAHAACTPCGSPATGTQIPSAPGTSQASHWPVQAWSQQTPSVQKAVAHASLVVQGAPAGILA
jgi:hypothetical protein